MTNGVRTAQAEVIRLQAELEQAERHYERAKQAIERTKKELTTYSQLAIDFKNAEHALQSIAEVQQILKVYKHKLKLHKLNRLENLVTECFLYLLHKVEHPLPLGLLLLPRRSHYSLAPNHARRQQRRNDLASLRGDLSDSLILALKQRCHNDGLGGDRNTLARQFRLHLHRGIGYLAADPNLRSIEDLVRLAVSLTPQT